MIADVEEILTLLKELRERNRNILGDQPMDTLSGDKVASGSLSVDFVDFVGDVVIPTKFNTRDVILNARPDLNLPSTV